jgi:hypothetical protein
MANTDCRQPPVVMAGADCRQPPVVMAGADCRQPPVVMETNDFQQPKAVMANIAFMSASLNFLMFYNYYILLLFLLVDIPTVTTVTAILCAIILTTGLLNDSSVAKFIFTSVPKYMTETYLQILTNVPFRTNPEGVIYACHPHGTLPCSTFAFLHNKVPAVVDKVMLSALLGPNIFKYLGFIDNTRKSIINNIAKYGCVALYPGGTDELCLTKGTSKDIIIYVREGFMRLAIENEYTIVPTLTAFEEDSYVPLFTGCNLFKHKLWTRWRLSVAPHIGSYGMLGIPRQTHKPTIHFCAEIKCSKDNTVEQVSKLFTDILAKKCDALGIKCTFMYSKDVA